MAKKTRNIICMIIVLTMLATTAYGQVDTLSSLGMLPDGFIGRGVDQSITRAEFAYMAAGLLSMENKERVDTQFSDVSQQSPYSGAIELLARLGIMNGVGGGVFNPDGGVTAPMAYKVIIQILGYQDFAEQSGGYPDGYTYMANMLGMAQRVYNSSGNLTRNDAVRLVNYVLTEEFNSVTYMQQNGELSARTNKDSSFSIFSQNLNLSVYSGVVTGIKPEKGTINVEIIKNRYDNNYTPLQEGETYTFNAAKGIDVYQYENMPVNIWVSSDDVVLHIEPKKDAVIKYGYIDSVNGDLREGSHYRIKYIERMTFFDDEDEYDVSPSAVLKYNEQETEDQVRLVGNFVKAIIIENEIIFIEGWDLKEGGLIKSVSDEAISFVKGSLKDAKVKDLHQLKATRVFLNNKPARLPDLKPNCVFDYYVDDNVLAVVASEKQIVDVLGGVSDSYLNIGSGEYLRRDVYCSENGIDYKLNDFSGLYNLTVCAYIGSDGYIKYIRPDAGEEIGERKFIGVVSGFKQDAFNEGNQLGIFAYGETVEQIICYLSKNTRYNDGITKEDLIANVKNLDGKGVYEFVVNSNNVITSVSKLIPYQGYGSDPVASVGSFIDAVAADVLVNGKTLYFTNAPIIAIYAYDGEFSVGKITWEELRGKALNSPIKMKFYGDEYNNSTPRLVVITGDMSAIGGRVKKYGIVTGRSTGLNKDGDMCVLLKVLEGGSEAKVYRITQELANTIPENALIYFNDDCKLSKDEIFITAITAERPMIDLGGKCKEWPTVSNERPEEVVIGLHRGTVESLDNNRLCLTDKNTYFMYQHNLHRLYVSVNENNPNKRFTGISYKDIEPGDEVFYYVSSNGIVRGIIKVE